MFKKTLSIHTLAAMMLLGGLSFTQLSCSQDQQRETAQTGDRAYNNFKGFVDQAEASATNVGNETQEDYDRETAQMKANFDAQVASVDSAAGQYDDQRRQEIEQLRNRYTAAYDKREAAWRDHSATAMNTDADGSMSSSGTMDNEVDSGKEYATMGKYYKPMKSYTSVSAAALPAVYKKFTDDVNKNKDNYDIADWRNVNSDWKRLNARKDELDPTLSGDAKREIAKQKVEYAAVKSYDKTTLRAEQGADAVAGTAKDAYKGAKSVGKDVGNTAVNVGEKVGDKAGDVGKDVGHTAAKVGEGAADVGKDAYKGAKKGVKKVGSAIGNVFDGKDKKKE